MDQEKEPLSISEQSIISRELLKMINRFPGMSSKVTASYQYISDSDLLGVFSMQGAVKLAEYLCMPDEESFDGQFPFFIRFRCKPTNTTQRIQKQDFLDRLGEWLEQQEFQELSDGRKIIEIQRTSTTFLTERFDNGMEDYQCNFNLIYEKR